MIEKTVFLTWIIEIFKRNLKIWENIVLLDYLYIIQANPEILPKINYQMVMSVLPLMLCCWYIAMLLP